MIEYTVTEHSHPQYYFICAPDLMVPTETEKEAMDYLDSYPSGIIIIYQKTIQKRDGNTE